ncbi:MAG: DJ-1 family glyoxalase III [Planctomycetota bacterium]|jgi:4-methyl-5(b-hydroxyethyl)-thiazole monophosphate biosynthesis
MSKKVLVAIADGTEELEAVTIIDVLRRAEADVTVASVGNKQVTASRGVNLVADAVISDCVGTVYDLIALPGGMPGAEHLRDSKELIEMLNEQAASGRLYAAICASPAIVLKPHGLLKDKKATCYPSLLLDLDNPEQTKVVVDGNCITSQGPATALEFSLKLIELLFDKQKSQEVAKAMLV